MKERLLFVAAQREFSLRPVAYAPVRAGNAPVNH